MSAMGPQLGVMMFVSMLVLMALRVPIAAAMFVPGVAGYWLLTDSMNTINFLKGSAVARLTVYELSVIPLFLLMGQFASQGGLSRDLFRAAVEIVEREAFGGHWVRPGTRVPSGALHAPGAGQHGLVRRDKSRDCYLVYASGPTEESKSALVLRELRSQDAGGRFPTGPSWNTDQGV